MIHQSGGCRDGSSPIWLPAADPPPVPGDVLLGTVGETPVYIDGDQDKRWQEPELLIDVFPGTAMGFSPEGSLNMRLVALSGQRR